MSRQRKDCAILARKAQTLEEKLKKRRKQMLSKVDDAEKREGSESMLAMCNKKDPENPLANSATPHLTKQTTTTQI